MKKNEHVAPAASFDAEAFSALVDGALPSDEARRVLRDCLSHPEGRVHWDMHHFIGDALRGQMLVNSDRSSHLIDRVMFEVAREPLPTASPAVTSVVMAPVSGSTSRHDQGRGAANASRWRLVAGFASVSALAAVVWLVSSGGLGGNSLGPTIAQAPVPAPASIEANASTEQAVMIRDARLDELLAAHRQFGGNSALQMPAGFLRNATFDSSR